MFKLSSLLLASTIIIFFFASIAVIAYVFSALGLYTMAKRKNIENAWLAWIPIASYFTLGKVINDKVKIGNKTINQVSTILLISSITILILTIGTSLFTSQFYNILVFIADMAFLVFFYICYYRLYKLYDSKNSAIYLILSIIFSILLPVFTFMIRNKDEIEYITEEI